MDVPDYRSGEQQDDDLPSLASQGRHHEIAGRLRARLAVASPDAFEARMWIYRMLMSNPEVPLKQEDFRDAVRITKYILQNKKNFSRRTLLAAHVVNQGFLYGADPDLDKERNELFALRSAWEELTSNSVQETDRHHALMIVAWCGETMDEKGTAVQELMDTGDEWGVTYACVGMDNAFHVQTDCDVLEKAIRSIKNPNYLAQIFVRKMGIMNAILPVYIDQKDAENIRLTLAHIQNCHINLQLLPCKPWWRAYDQYHMARMADTLGDNETAKMLAVSASVLARKINIAYLQQQVQALIDELMGEEEG